MHTFLMGWKIKIKNKSLYISLQDKSARTLGVLDVDGYEVRPKKIMQGTHARREFFTTAAQGRNVYLSDHVSYIISIIFPCERSDAGEYGFCTYGRIGQSEEG